MLSKVHSLGLAGIAGYGVETECYIGTGLPAFELVGLPDASVKEARERVRAAVKNSGFRFPVSRIIVNLAPAGTKKSGTLYDRAGCGRCRAFCRWPSRPGRSATRRSTSPRSTRARRRSPRA